MCQQSSNHLWDNCNRRHISFSVTFRQSNAAGTRAPRGATLNRVGSRSGVNYDLWQMLCLAILVAEISITEVVAARFVSALHYNTVASFTNVLYTYPRCSIMNGHTFANRVLTAVPHDSTSLTIRKLTMFHGGHILKRANQKLAFYLFPAHSVFRLFLLLAAISMVTFRHRAARPHAVA